MSIATLSFHRRRIVSLIVLGLAGAAGCGGQPADRAPKASEPSPASEGKTTELAPAPQAPQAPVPLAEYFKIQRTFIGGEPFTHDEKWVGFISDRGGRPDLWLAPLSGGDPRQVTRVEGFLMGYAFSPATDHLVYLADQGGSELAHLYLTNSAGEEPKDLNAADPEGTRSMFASWAKDGRSFLYLCNRRDPKYLDLYEYVVKSGKSQLLWESSGNLSFELASDDHKKIVINETLSDVDSNLYLLDRSAGKKKAPVLLTPHEGDVLHFATDFSPDGKRLHYVSDAGREFQALYTMDLKSKESSPLLSADWDVEAGHYSFTGKYFVTYTNEDGTPKVVVQDAKSQEAVNVPSIGAGTALAGLRFSKSDRYIAANLVSDAMPTAPVLIDLEESTAALLADPLPESLRGRPMVSATSVRITSFDERPVPAFLLTPPGDGPFPAVIDVHGGPTAQSRRVFDPMRQYLVSKGYVVLVPNVRGSTGYGKSFTKLDNLDLGGGPLQDVVACKAWLAKEAKVDPNRVVVSGGSYGGYMSLAAAAFTPKEFAAHIDYFGVSDLKSLVESFPPYWASFATYIYAKFGDPKNPEHAAYQRDRSPLNFVEQMERPLLVVQGANDARVKKDQSDRIVAKLRERQVPVHYLVIEGEGHGFSKNENRLRAYTAADAFLDRYIFGDTSVTVPETPAAE